MSFVGRFVLFQRFHCITSQGTITKNGIVDTPSIKGRNAGPLLKESTAFDFCFLHQFDRLREEGARKVKELEESLRQQFIGIAVCLSVNVCVYTTLFVQQRLQKQK